MPLFGSSSKSSTHTSSVVNQAGAEGEGNLVAGGNVTTNFDDNIKSTVDMALDGAFGIAKQSAVDFQQNTSDVVSAISEIARAEKTPERAWLPFAFLAAGVVAVAAIWGARR